MSNELLEIEQTTALQVFTVQGGLDPIINKARETVAEFEHDLSTASGRKRTASLASNVAKLKVKLDGLGKESTADLKSRTKIVDESRKAMREELDELKYIARKPLTDWEDECARVEAEKASEIEAANLKKQIEFDHEIGLMANAEFDRTRKLARELKDKSIYEHEEKLKKEAAENAQRETSDKIMRLERERDEAERRELDAVTLKASAERLAAARAEAVAASAVLREQEKVSAELSRVESERVKREADIDNRRNVNTGILNVMKDLGLSKEMSIYVITAIVNGKIPNVSISY